jgi:GTPase SAR1 family protein
MPCSALDSTKFSLLNAPLAPLQMFGLLSGLYRQFTYRPTVNLLIIGLDNAGKTTTLQRVKRIFGSNEEAETERERVPLPTVGLNRYRIFTPFLIVVIKATILQRDVW